jgi:glycosyltransferase involved in cell wall biosynthesis
VNLGADTSLPDDAPRPSISVVVVAYDMGRELPRTLASLAPVNQRGVRPDDYEVIVVDNGSPTPVAAEALDEFGRSGRLLRIDPAPASPARAANAGIGAARADLIGLVVDGARIASAGLVAAASRAAHLALEPIITAPAYHLCGAGAGHDPVDTFTAADEDRLLARVGWPDDPGALFAHSTIAASSARGWFAPMGESSSLFMLRRLWDELGGLDERFALPGGGLVNHDLYRRACETDGTDLFVLVGEGTFHQRHGGAATSGRIAWEEMQRDHVAIRGERYRPPARAARLVGRVRSEALGYVQYSLERRDALLSAAP